MTSKATHNTHKKFKGKMSNTRGIRDFYKTSNNKISPFLTSVSGSLNQAELHAISEEVKSSVQPLSTTIQAYQNGLRMKLESML